MSCAVEALGMALPGTATGPAVDTENKVTSKKENDCRKVVEALFNLMECKILAQQILTRKAFENAIAVMFAVGGSTNGVLHLLALAHEAKVRLDINDFNKIGDRVPIIVNVSPHGKYHTADIDTIGGLPIVMKELLAHGLIHGDCLTVSGHTVAENLAAVPSLSDLGSQDMVFGVDKPFSSPGRHIIILKGNLCPESAVLKLSGKQFDNLFIGPAVVFDNEQDAYDAVMAGRIKAGDVLVIRYQGPKGSPGMPEMLSPSAALVGAGLGQVVALVTDGRFSGASHGITYYSTASMSADLCLPLY
jgi:dihydroxy-acid dehydratase